jgi:hypothetical protein
MKAELRKRTIRLTDEQGQPLGELRYQGLFSSKATIACSENQWEIGSPGISGGFRISRQGRQEGTVKPGWKKYRIEWDEGARIRIYYLLHKGIWNSHFVLNSDYHKELLRLIPRFRWKTLDWDFSVEAVPGQGVSPELILVAIHTARAMSAGAVAFYG